MLCVPAVSAALLQTAVRVLPEPARETAAQPAMLAPPSVKFSVPVGAAPVTEPVKVTLAPTIDGLVELPTAVVVVVFAFTTCDSVELVEAAFDPSPP